MSDRETSPSPQENGSHHSDERSPSPQGSRSPGGDDGRRSRSPRSRSHSRSRSRSYSRSYSRRRHSCSRSRSRSRSRRHRHHYCSRSRSRSPRHRRYDRHRDYYRSRSRSPMSARRRHVGNRDNPQPSRCLGVFGLSLYTQERDLRAVFSKYGPLEDVQVVYDAQTGRSRGFSFVYFENVEDSKQAKERCNGQEIDGRKIRVDYSITQRAHTPTPGIYMGKPTYPRYGGGSGGSGGYRNRSPSPYYSRSSRRYSRSRSRSYSPRKYGYY